MYSFATFITPYLTIEYVTTFLKVLTLWFVVGAWHLIILIYLKHKHDLQFAPTSWYEEEDVDDVSIYVRILLSPLLMVFNIIAIPIVFLQGVIVGIFQFIKENKNKSDKPKGP